MPLPSFPSLSNLSFRQIVRMASTLAIAFAGGSAAAYIGLPAGWLSGALVATAIAALCGAPVGIGRGLRTAIFIVLGTSMGAALTPETLKGVATWPVTMIVLVVSIPVMMAAVIFYLEKVAGWDRRSSFFAAAPGALSAVLVMAESCGADVRRVVFGQTLRLFILVALLPVTLGGLGHEPAGTLPITPVVSDWTSFGLSLAVGIAAGLIAERIHLPGGAMVGAMLASGTVHATGLIEGRLPDILMIIGFVALGANTGSRFAGTKLETLRRFFIDGLAAFAIATVIAVIFAVIGAALSGEPLTKVLMAYVPGALEAMTIMAFVLGLDPAFVAAHHLARFLLLALVIPVLGRFLFGVADIPSERIEADRSEPKD